MVALACTQSSAKLNYVFKDSAKPGIVAKIGTTEITEEELLSGEARINFIELKKKEYDLKLEQLNKLVQERLIGEEAKKANMSLDDYMKKSVLKKEIKIGDGEYNEFVKAKKIPEAQITPQLKDRIFTFMKEEKQSKIVQDYVAKLTKNNPVEVYFKKPKLAIAVDVGNAPIWGNPNAKVTVVEFSDFQCPFCSRGAETLTELKNKYKGKIKIAFKHFPLSFHKDAKPAAESAMCVGDQGPDKFWKFHDIVFKNQKDLTPEALEKYATQSGANAAKYKECLTSKKFAAAVDADIAYGEKLGVRSTPTFFVNGELVAGALPADAFSDIIDEALK